MNFVGKYYVYAHSNEKYGIFYVGKGSGNRLLKTSNRNKFWKRIVDKHGFSAEILCLCKDETESYEKECEYIKKYKDLGQCHANFTNGGDGVKVDKRWWNEKISASLKGKKRNLGKESHSYKDFCTKDELYDLRVLQNKTTTFIANKYLVSVPTVCARLKEYGFKTTNGKEIYCHEKNMVFKSISDAAEALSVYRENIRKVLANKYKHTGGFTFSYRGNNV